MHVLRRIELLGKLGELISRHAAVYTVQGIILLLDCSQS